MPVQSTRFSWTARPSQPTLVRSIRQTDHRALYSDLIVIWCLDDSFATIASMISRWILHSSLIFVVPHIRSYFTIKSRKNILETRQPPRSPRHRPRTFRSLCRLCLTRPRNHCWSLMRMAWTPRMAETFVWPSRAIHIPQIYIAPTFVPEIIL